MVVATPNKYTCCKEEAVAYSNSANWSFFIRVINRARLPCNKASNWCCNEKSIKYGVAFKKQMASDMKKLNNFWFCHCFLPFTRHGLEE